MNIYRKNYIENRDWKFTGLVIYQGNCFSNVRHLTFKKGNKVKLANLVEGDPKTQFSIATTPRCCRGHFSIPRIAPFTLSMLSAKQGGIKYHLLSLWYDSNLDWTSVSPTIWELATNLAN